MKQVDARGKACPLPVIETKKALEGMKEGAVEVLVDKMMMQVVVVEAVDTQKLLKGFL